MCLNVDQDYHKYLCYAYRITGCNDAKYDLVSDTFIKIHGILEKSPEKELNNGYIYLTMRSIFFDSKRRQLPQYLEEMEFEKECEPGAIVERLEVVTVLSSMEFRDREILLKTQEESLRSIAKKVGVNHQTVNNLKKKATEKFKELWQNQY